MLCAPIARRMQVTTVGGLPGYTGIMLPLACYRLTSQAMDAPSARLHVRPHQVVWIECIDGCTQPLDVAAR